MVMEYELTFGEIPFTSDEARVFRISTTGFDSEDTEQLPPRKHQAKTSLLDEIDRLMPFGWLYDILPPPQFPSFNIGLIAASSRLAQDPRIEDMRIGDFYYPNTASRFSMFRGLATSSIIEAMGEISDGGLTPQTFRVKNNPFGPQTPFSYEIETPMYMLSPRIISEGDSEGLFIVTLVDERFFLLGTPITLKPTVTTAWNDLLTIIANQAGINLTLPTVDAVYGRPDPDSVLWMNNENISLVLDAIAYNIGCIVVRNLDGTYKLQTPASAVTVVSSNRGSPRMISRVAGGDMFAADTVAGGLSQFKNGSIPASVTVSFPKYVYGGDPVPHFLNTRPGGSRWQELSYGETYDINIPSTSGGPLISGVIGLSDQTIRNTAKALYSTEASAVSGQMPDNISGLMSLALRVVRDRYEADILDGLDETYAGTVLWTPEAIHDILWRWSEKDGRATTRIMRPEWNVWVSDLQHNIGISGSFGVSGIAGHTVAQTWRNQSGVQYDGVNLVTAGSGLALVSGVKTSGGITEVILTSDGSSNPAESYYSGAINSGVYPNYTLPDAQIIRLLVNGSVYIPSFTPPLIGSGKNGWTFEVMNMAPFATNGNAPSTISWAHEDSSTSPPEWRINTPDGLPLNQQPQETIKFKYSDGRYKIVERPPTSPFPAGGGSPGGSVNISFPLKWPLLSGSPGIGMPIPSSGYVEINMGWDEPIDKTTSGTLYPINRTFGQIPHLEYVNASGTAGVLLPSPFMGWIDRDATPLIASYLTAGGNGGITPNPTSGIFSGSFAGLDLQSGDGFFSAPTSDGSILYGNLVYISDVVSGGSPGGNGPEWAGFWVIQSGPWRRATWYLSGQTYGGYGLVYNYGGGVTGLNGIISTKFFGLGSGDPVLSQTRYNGYQVGESGMIPPRWVGANSGGIGNLPSSIMSGMMASGAINIIGRSGIISQQTAPNVWTLGLNLSGAIGSGIIVSGGINQTNLYFLTFSGYFPPAPGYGSINTYSYADLTVDGPGVILYSAAPANGQRAIIGIRNTSGANSLRYFYNALDFFGTRTSGFTVLSHGNSETLTFDTNVPALLGPIKGLQISVQSEAPGSPTGYQAYLQVIA